MNSRWWSVIAWVAVVVYGGLFAYIAVEHVLYPGFSEAMEGDILQHIERVSQGLDPYPAPDGEYVALAYMPLYYYLAAPFYAVFGDGFVGPRLLSCLCALLSGVLVGWIAWRESASRPIALFAAALFFAGFRIMDGYLACAMPDALLLFWTLLGYSFLAYGTTRFHDLAWLLSFMLAFWTKQHGAFFFGFAVLYALLFRKNALPRWGLLLGIIIGGPVAYLLIGQVLGERFYFHTFGVPGRWEHSGWYALRRTGFVLAYCVPFCCVLTGLYLRSAVRLREWKLAPLAWFTVTTLLATMVTMTAAGSSNNHYIPLLAVMSITTLLGVQSLLAAGAPRMLGVWIGFTGLATTLITVVALRLYPNHAIMPFVPMAVVAVVVLYGALRFLRIDVKLRHTAAAALLLLGQFAVVAYSPSDHLPPSDYRTALASLREELARIDGSLIWVPHGNVPSALSGLKLARAPSWVALEDLQRQRHEDGKPDLDVERFWTRIRGERNLYVLSHEPIATVPVWDALASELELVRDYREQFATLPDIGFHWYGGRSFPRYLYRHRPVLASTGGNTHAAR